MSDNPADKAIEFIRLNSETFAKAKAQRRYLEEFRKSKKALLMSEFNRDNPKARASDAEIYAYAHSDYIKLLDGIKVAIEEEERLRWLLTGAQNRFDQWRTLEASNRKEFKNHGI